MFRCWRFATAVVFLAAWSALLLGPSYVLCQQNFNTIVVRSGFELHAALTSPQITQILVASNINFSLDTCPFPSAEGFQATLISRNITIASLTAETAAAAGNLPGSQQQQQQQTISAPTAAAGTGPPYVVNCNYLTDRFELRSGHQVTLSNLILRNCRTYSVFGFFRKTPGSSIVMDRVVDDRGAVCVPLTLYYEMLVGSIGVASAGFSALQQQLPGSEPYQQRRQDAHLTQNGSTWCAAAGNVSNDDGSSFQSPVSASSSDPVCQQRAVLLTNVSYQDTSFNSNGTFGIQFGFSATNSVALCPQPIPQACMQSRGVAACLADAYDAVNPDNLAPCPVTDGISLQGCLQNPAFRRIVVVQSAMMNLTTSPATAQPILIERDVTIMSDPRGPRLNWDCGLLSNRFQLSVGYTLTLYHLIITNCTSTRPLSFIRVTAGSRLIFNDTFVVQPPGLCAPVDPGAFGRDDRNNTGRNNPNNTAGQRVAPGAISPGSPRPDSVPGVQQFEPPQRGDWCNRNDGLVDADTSTGPQDNSSYSAIGVNVDSLGVFANTTGLGPAYAATIAAPAAAPWYVHPSWPSNALCTDTEGPPPILIVDYAVTEPTGWIATNSSDQQQQTSPRFGSSLDQIGGSYSGDYILRYIKSVLLCPSLAAPDGVGRGCSPAVQGAACQAQIYNEIDPDRQLVPGAAAYAEALAAGTLNGGGNHGVQVVLPAVLASVGGAAILGAIIAALVRRHKRNKAAADKLHHLPTSDPKHQHTSGGPLAWLGLSPAGPSTPGSSDPARQLLGVQSTPTSGSRSPVGTGIRGRMLQQTSGPDGIQLGQLLGAGSFGRVYAGTWRNKPVAVKVITHSRADDDRINQELSLSVSFDHPNLVRALHYARVDINPHTPLPSEFGSDLFLPEGAVGVFTLPTNWDVVQRTQAASARGQAPAIDTETWIVMDLMDKGNLAAALRHSNFFIEERTGALALAPLLRRAADVASGLAYLHSRSVCHGDLKWENVLLKTERRDPDGVMAKVADFGLSRALAFGQSHLSTRRYGTVTHMPPELLVAGKLTPAADVYSFGIMLWELVSRSLPFKGLHHGEIIHKVVTEDLRPSPWPSATETGLALPADYIPLAEACWARRAGGRPTMAEVLQRLLDMLEKLEAHQGLPQV